MTNKVWTNTRVPSAEKDRVWELFHENSKSTRYQVYPSQEEILARMAELFEVLPYEGAVSIPLPAAKLPQEHSLLDALQGRASAEALGGESVSLTQLATLLHFGYGSTRSNEGTPYPRRFRGVPSGGALYPLELYVYASRVEGLPPGVYHFDPLDHELDALMEPARGEALLQGFVEPEKLANAAAVIFVTGIFRRSTFKYGPRGYRFALIEAGHVAQNVNLVAQSLGLAYRNFGGYFDHDVDEMLDLDGMEHSTIYVLGVGSLPDAPPEAE